VLYGELVIGCLSATAQGVYERPHQTMREIILAVKNKGKNIERNHFPFVQWKWYLISVKSSQSLQRQSEMTCHSWCKLQGD
jgi:hypothetical protein